MAEFARTQSEDGSSSDAGRRAVLGAPEWADVAVGDMPAEQAFYADVLGWRFSEPQGEFGGWRQAHAGADAVAGMTPRPAGVGISAWMTYFHADDVDAAAARIAALGGTVLGEPIDVVTGGEVQSRLAIATDPSGAMFGIHQPGRHDGFAGEGPGHAVWFELLSRDLPGAIAFYSQLLDATAEESSAGPAPYVTLRVGPTPICGLMAMPPQVAAEVPSYWAPYFEVADVDAATEAATSRGATVLMGPETMEPGRIVMLMDPEDAMVNLIAPSGAASV